jgi:hypothetical protein
MLAATICRRRIPATPPHSERAAVSYSLSLGIGVTIFSDRPFKAEFLVATSVSAV